MKHKDIRLEKCFIILTTLTRNNYVLLPNNYLHLEASLALWGNSHYF